MALTNLSQVTSSGIHTLSNYTTHNINSTGIITATEFSGNLSSASGISTFSEIRVTGNLTVEGTTTTLDSVLNEVDRLEIGANTAAVGLAVTQSGTGHVATFEGGNVGIGTDNPTSALEIRTTTTNAATHYRNNASNGGAYFGVRGANLGAASAGEAYIYSYNSGINLLADGTGYIDFATGGTASKVRIKSDGKVGIGTDDPGTSLLRVHGGTTLLTHASANDATTKAEMISNAALRVRPHTSNSGNLNFAQVSSGAAIGLQYTNGPGTANWDIALQPFGGNVGIGITNPAERLAVVAEEDSNATDNGLSIYRSVADDKVTINAQGGAAKFIADGGSSYIPVRFYRYNGTNLYETLTIGADGNVGIGTVNPTQKLELLSTGNTIVKLGGASANTTGIIINRGGSEVSRIAHSNSDDLSFYTTSSVTERLRITSAGNIGIGTTNPVAKLEIVDSYTNRTWTPTSQTELLVERNGNCIISAIGSTISNCVLNFGDSDDENVGAIDYDHDDDSMGFRVNGAERLLVSSTGRISQIGNNEDIDMDGTASGQLKLDGNGYNAALALNTEGLNIYTNSANRAIIFGTNETERLRITSAGDVGIGTDNPNYLTTIAAGSGNAKLNLKRLNTASNGNAFGSIFFTNMSGTDVASVRAHRESAADDAYLGFSTRNTSGSITERLRITSGGAIAVGTASQMGSNYARISIDCHGRDVLTDVTDITKYGLAFHNDPNTNDANGIGFFNDDGTNCGGYILHQDKGSNNLGDLIFGTSETSNNPIERLRIKSDGKVGIGTDNVDYKLEVFGDPGADGDFSIKSNASAAGGTEHSKLRFRVRNPSNQESTKASIHVESAANWGGNLIFGTKTASGGLSETTVERLRITHDGEVGIGTDDPGAPLHVATSASEATIAIFGSMDGTSGSTYQALQIRNNVASYPALANASSTDTLDLRSSGSVQVTIDDNNNDTTKFFRVTANGTGDSGTQLFRVQEDGKVGVPSPAESSALLGINAASTSELTNSSPLYNQGNPCYLQIKNTTDDISDPECGIILQPRNSANGSVAIFAKRTGSYTSDLVYRVRTGASTSAVRLRIKNDGNISIGDVTSPDAKVHIRNSASYGKDAYATANTGNSQSEPPGTFKWDNNTPVASNNGRGYRAWVQSGDAYPNASDYIDVMIRNSGFYRITLKRSHSSVDAAVCQMMIYGLANSTNSYYPVVHMTGASGSGTNHSTVQSGGGRGSSNAVATFYWEIHSYNVNTHDTIIRIHTTGNNNQGIVALIEKI